MWLDDEVPSMEPGGRRKDSHSSPYYPPIEDSKSWEEGTTKGSCERSLDCPDHFGGSGSRPKGTWTICVRFLNN